MKKIKPEVIGFQRVFNDGDMSFIVIPKCDLHWCCEDCESISIHKNGKPKFRLVYKNTKLPTLK